MIVCTADATACLWLGFTIGTALMLVFFALLALGAKFAETAPPENQSPNPAPKEYPKDWE